MKGLVLTRRIGESVTLIVHKGTVFEAEIKFHYADLAGRQIKTVWDADKDTVNIVRTEVLERSEVDGNKY
jgi:sRNA-binding carbon storage regulator CsrA